MGWFNNIRNKIEKDLRDQDISDAVYSIKNKILFNKTNFTHTEQVHILNTVVKDFVESKKQKRKELMLEAQEIKDILLKFQDR
jgi:hypothetical protein